MTDEILPTTPDGPGPDSPEAKLTSFAEDTAREVSHSVVGMQRELRQSLAAILAGGHVLLEGPPGVAKTLLVRSIAAALGGSYRRIQFTPDLMPSDVTGSSIFRPGES